MDLKVGQRLPSGSPPPSPGAMFHTQSLPVPPRHPACPAWPVTTLRCGRRHSSPLPEANQAIDQVTNAFIPPITLNSALPMCQALFQKENRNF